MSKIEYYNFLHRVPSLEEKAKQAAQAAPAKKKKKRSGRARQQAKAAAAATAAANKTQNNEAKTKEKSSEEAASSSNDRVTTFSVKKSENFASWYEQIIPAAEIMDKRYPVKGMPIFRPYGYYLHHKMMDIIGDEWEKQGIERALFPLLIPEQFLKLEGEHVAGFEKEVYWVTHGGLKEFQERKLLRPTSETVIYHMFHNWIRSFRDLPVKVHQTCNVFRYETKQTRPLIRAREIHWNEAHTAHETPEEALENLEAAWKSYLYLINDCCCFYGLRLRRPEWDKFPGSVHTDVMDTVMPCGRVLQTVGAHFLGQKFARAFNILFTDRENQEQHPHLTCYGISTRLLAATLSIHGDDKGLVLPPMLARYQVVVVPIHGRKKTEKEQVHEAAQQVVKVLSGVGVRCLLDDSDKNPGPKFYYHEMKGVPLRIELGPRDLRNGQVTLVARDTLDKSVVEMANLAAGVQNAMDQLTSRLQAAAKQFHDQQVTTCLSMDALKVAIAKGGFARIPFYSMGLDGEEGDKAVHDACGGEVRGSLVGEAPPDQGTKCIVTGNPATAWGYVARSY